VLQKNVGAQDGHGAFTNDQGPFGGIEGASSFDRCALRARQSRGELPVHLAGHGIGPAFFVQSMLRQEGKRPVAHTQTDAACVSGLDRSGSQSSGRKSLMIVNRPTASFLPL